MWSLNYKYRLLLLFVNYINIFVLLLSWSFGVTNYCFVSKDLLIPCRSFSKIHQRNVRESFWLILPDFNVNLNAITNSVIFRQFSRKLRFKTVQNILFLSVLDPRVCHTMDVLSAFISVLYDCVCIFHWEFCPCLDIFHFGFV